MTDMKNRIITLDVKYKWNGYFLKVVLGALVIMTAGSVFAAIKSEQLRELQKQEYDANYNDLLERYDWKTERLRVYTDIIYRTK